jgi:hypothetical protein
VAVLNVNSYIWSALNLFMCWGHFFPSLELADFVSNHWAQHFQPQ